MRSQFITMFTMLVFSGCLSTGCAFIKPTTAFSINPITRTISFVDTKDNDIEVTGVTYSPENGFGLESLIVSNKSSPVIEADVAQMLAFVEQQRAANEGIAQALAGISNIVANLSTIVAELNTGGAPRS